MINSVLILSVFFMTPNGQTHFQQQRLTGAGSTTGQVAHQYAFPSGYVPNTQYMEKYTFSPISRNVGDISDGETGFIPHSPNTAHYSYPVHFYPGHHHHGFGDESSEQQFGKPRNIEHPEPLPLNDPEDKTKHTTDRHYRDTQPAKNVHLSTVPPKKNVTHSRNVGDQNNHKMAFPTDKEIAKVFKNPQQPQTPVVKLLNPNSSARNCSFGLCDEVEDYPEERILNIINRSKELKQYFSKLALDASDFVFNRFGEDEDTMCSTMVHTQFPRSAPNTNNEERILVNVGDYKQGIVFETCASDGMPCKYADVFPNNYSTSCKQKYTIRRLMAVGKESDKAVFDNFHLPSCCVCVIKKS